MNTTPRPRFGELLVQHELISAEDLDKILVKQKSEGGKLSHLLVASGYVDETTLVNFLANQLGIPFVDLKNYALNPSVCRELSESHARRFQAILLEENSEGYLVGMVDPQDIIAVDELTHRLGRPIKLAIVGEKDFTFALNSIYPHGEEISTYAKALSQEVASPKAQADAADGASLQDAYDAPVTKLLQSLFHDAVQMRASDIHIEPDEGLLRIRQRIDGVLHENIIKETGIAQALALRLKLMAGLKIAEKRLPQDGRFSIKIYNRSIDVRLSSMPVQHGESIVMRLLDQTSLNLKIDQLGIPEEVLATLKRLIQLPNGMVLVTGPTGSGKTSTLYSLLNELNKPENKIITVEDPVEYRLPRINQVQVHAQIGLTFASVLRSALRQDPDILMVGEIRDKETATIALNAAMTGHFVLATMHTNDAISSAMRLMEMENDGYVVAAGLSAVIAQRLLRKICETCAEPYEPTPREQAWLQRYLGEKMSSATFKKGKGCVQCFHTGYKGRIPTFEIFEINNIVAEALIKSDLVNFSETVKKEGFVSLAENAIGLASKGITTIEEVVRVSFSAEDLKGIQSHANV
jgi:MSHA biogenesis protein MshE